MRLADTLEGKARLLADDLDQLVQRAATASPLRSGQARMLVEDAKARVRRALQAGLTDPAGPDAARLRWQMEQIAGAAREQVVRLGHSFSPRLHLFLTELDTARDVVRGWRLPDEAGRPSAMAPAIKRKKREVGQHLARLRRRMRAAPLAELDELVTEQVRQLWCVVGEHEYLANLLDTTPFRVEPVLEGSHIVDITIGVRPVPLPLGMLDFKREVDAAATIITTVMDERARKNSPLWSPMSRADIRDARHLYLKELVGLARVGLETLDDTHRRFAENDLRRLKALFTLKEAGFIKNAYVQRLLRVASLWMTVNLMLYGCARAHVLARWSADAAAVAYDMRNFFLLLAGTAVGTWLSFSLRNPELDFANLAVLERDRLNPGMRLLYMMGLAGLVGLMLWSGAVVIGIGSVQGLDAMHGKGTFAVLIGLLAGIAERTLGRAVAARGEALASAIGSSPALTKPPS